MVDYLVDLRENAVRNSEDVRASMLPYFLWEPTEEGDWQAALVSDVQELRADRIFRGQLGRYGRTVSWLHKRIDRLFVPANTEMTEVILAYLDGRPLPPASESN